jgi:hypothetical protein
MDDLINRRVAIDALRAIKHGLWEIDIPSPTVPEYVEHHEQIKNMMEIVDGWIKRVKEEPAVDAVPVIRCRDCVHNDLPPTAGNALCSIYDGMTEVYGFCYKGERREE